MFDISFLLKVSRPRFWFYILGPYVVGLVAGSANITESAQPILFLIGLYFTLPANLLIYGVNDIFDYETDRINEKKANYEALVMPDRRRELWIAIAVTNLPFVAVLFYANAAALIGLATFLFLSIFYSAPPIRAKTKPFLDSAFNILYAMPGFFAYSLKTGEFAPAILAAAAGCWTAAMHAFSAIPDIEVDRRAGLATIATLCGPYGTIAVCFVLYGAAAVLSASYLGFASFTVGSAYLILMLASIYSVKTGRIFNLYRAFPLINIAAGFVLFWTIALSRL
jgi:lycopene elongase/hydratase (dihydrobisanhydrobacterioruberin-forming)